MRYHLKPSEANDNALYRFNYLEPYRDAFQFATRDLMISVAGFRPS